MTFRWLSETEKRTIDSLYKTGNSGTFISKLIGHSRSAVNSYIAKTFGKRIQRDKITMNLSSKEKLGEFIGAFAGDGNLYYSDKKHYQVSIFTDLKESAYAAYLSFILKELFSRKPHIRLHKGLRGYTTLIVQIHGKEIVDLIRHFLTFKSGGGDKKTYTVKLAEPVNSYNKNFLRGFIRGLVASDGSVYFKYSTKFKRFFKNLEVNLTSKELATQYKEALDIFGIKNHLYTYIPKNPVGKTVYEVQVRDTSAIRRFYYKIGLSEERKMAKLENIILASIPSESFRFLQY